MANSNKFQIIEIKDFFNYKKAYAWFIYPALAFYPYKWAIFNLFRSLATADYGIERQDQLLGLFVIITFPLFTLLCIIIGMFIMGKNSADYPNKGKRLLKRFVKLPSSVNSVRWAQYKNDYGAGLHILLCANDLGNILSTPKSTVDPYDLQIPQWVQRNLGTQELTGYEANHLIPNSEAEVNLYKISDNKIYVNAFFKGQATVPELTP